MPIWGHHIPFNRQNVLGITTEEGVFELFKDEIIYFGAAVDDPHGLRGLLESHIHGELGDCTAQATQFKFEVNARPERRLEELLDEFFHEHGFLPRCNLESADMRAKYGVDGPTAI